MSNMNKILITVVSCVFMICIASVSIVSIVTSNDKETTTTDAPPSQVVSTTESTTAVPPASGQTTTPQLQSNTSDTLTSSSAASTGSAVTGSLEADLLGKWTDSAGMSGFEFLEGGRVNLTYVDLAQFGVPFDGTASGLYTLEGDKLTIKFSIYTATIKKVYRISVSQNELSMFDLEEMEASTYARVS